MVSFAFVETFTWSARHTFAVTNSGQLMIVQKKGMERRREVKSGKGESDYYKISTYKILTELVPYFLIILFYCQLIYII